MTIFSRYLMRNIFIGFAAAAGLLIPLFTTFNLINELDDVAPGGYRWTQALLVVVMTLPRSLVDLAPFIALLGGIVGLGQLSKSLELTAIRTAGFSISRIARVMFCAGLVMTLTLGAVDEWVAAPLQQRALQIKNVAMAKAESDSDAGNALWARSQDDFVTVQSLDNRNQPVGIEIFSWQPDLTLKSYIFAQSATIAGKGMWTLHNVTEKRWDKQQETVNNLPEMQWHSLFSGEDLKRLTLPAESLSARQLADYIVYLHKTGQPSLEYESALWQKAGRPILILAMILLAVPFTFSTPRAPGLGSRLALGVIVGLVTWIVYQIVLNLGILFTINAQLTTLVPPVLLLGLAVGLIYRFDRRLKY
ncbi:LPS export ABC transporter permease LptG [Erwinia billingiae]|uniref:LPS export ABC transporter permease LptG n=1 Tax=Erwinia billingiae TaxID=182337 RepID=UPI0019CFD58A|nr:LPS export ABC transporter permease LptG [Erwinia billingiae]MBN7122337.1 LPS export ABC transporter permease LptG [Erwinia billingiae]